MNNDKQNTVNDYSFTLRELWELATDNMPDDVPDFLVLLTMRARIALNGETFQRQRTIEEQKTVNGDD